MTGGPGRNGAKSELSRVSGKFRADDKLQMTRAQCRGETVLPTGDEFLIALTLPWMQCQGITETPEDNDSEYKVLSTRHPGIREHRLSRQLRSQDLPRTISGSRDSLFSDLRVAESPPRTTPKSREHRDFLDLGVVGGKAVVQLQLHQCNSRRRCSQTPKWLDSSFLISPYELIVYKTPWDDSLIGFFPMWQGERRGRLQGLARDLRVDSGCFVSLFGYFERRVSHGEAASDWGGLGSIGKVLNLELSCTRKYVS
ncbi:hypothetical protein WN48_09743 [Eufriesea mexicana]|uniref:Uncharacterized protein n=1 Tax=Eufriesea mexicana TaxID=516756 RepID=A0A310SJJ3_9HYME|nr:hypothetical protein WN48_09743 [Eufriesea mexicana]